MGEGEFLCCHKRGDEFCFIISVANVYLSVQGLFCVYVYTVCSCMADDPVCLKCLHCGLCAQTASQQNMKPGLLLSIYACHWNVCGCVGKVKED